MDGLTIRPYQAEGIEFLVTKQRAALFDRPGLGKSMQSLLSMDSIIGDGGRILVVAPGDALGVWQDEADRWLDDDAPVYAGTKAQEKMLSHQGVVITNYHRMMTAIDYGDWHGIIFDESQLLRNRNTRTLFKALRDRFDKARYGLDAIPAYFLSGTPIVKNTGDLWPILHLINRRRWNSYWKFVEEYTEVWTTPPWEGGHRVVEGTRNLPKLWRELEDVALRRLEGEVPLPPKIRQRVPLTMTPTQAKVYRAIEKEMMADLGDGYLLTPTVLARETRLRQLLVCPMLVGVNDYGAILPALADWAWRNDDAMVVFTPFTEALSYYESYLERTNRPIWAIHGGMGQGFHDSVKDFNKSAANGEQPILLCQVSMGKSWSVSRATHSVFFAGCDWNATTHEQAEDRLHRDGQTEPVLAGYFAHRDTHDLDQLEVVEGKRSLADLILDRKRRRK